MEDDLECYNFKKEIDNSKRTTPINQIHNENERQNQNQYQNQEIENSLPPLKFPKISPEVILSLIIYLFANFHSKNINLNQVEKR